MNDAKQFLIDEARNLAKVICQNDLDGPEAERQLRILFSELTKLDAMMVATSVAIDMYVSDCYRMAAFFCPQYELLNGDAARFRRLIDRGNIKDVVAQLSRGTLEYSLCLIFLIEAGRSHSSLEIKSHLETIADVGEQIDEIS